MQAEEKYFVGCNSLLGAGNADQHPIANHTIAVPAKQEGRRHKADRPQVETKAIRLVGRQYLLQSGQGRCLHLHRVPLYCPACCAQFWWM